MIIKESYAFPVVLNENMNYFYGGLTKREYFAAMAMQGLLAAHNIYETGVDHDVNSMHSLLAADALIKALNEPQP